MSVTRPASKRATTKTSTTKKKALRPKTLRAALAPEPVSDQMLNVLLDLAEDCAELAADLDSATSSGTADEAITAIGSASVRLDRLARGMACLKSTLDQQAFEAARQAARALPAAAAPSSPQ